ncbi:hypothetical protein [Streptomyces soliscabiei]|uniref:hypothetical protein n=1 Tax=Streptomyces soliscabiei TaxID=588897 RepID=UPI0029B55811|nr:hypothetical protein [Streptomyces sp. NY05-11A]MDX2678339.1 hypothetical protein [Streptomyces sp. NY05-11A]
MARRLNRRTPRASDYYPPSPSAGRIPPGYGGLLYDGLLYDILYDGRAVVMAVRPAGKGEELTSRS